MSPAKSSTLLALSAVTITALLAGCGDESPGDTDGPAGGSVDVLEGTDTTTVNGVDFPVTVPSGRWTFTVSEPTTDLPDDVSGDAAADTSYVGLAWAPAGEAPEFGPVLLGQDPEVATVTTTGSDGSTQVTLLGPPDQGGKANGVVWVPVAEDAADPTLVVEYDGLDQRFDLADGTREPGPADGFYVDDPSLEGACPTRSPTAEQRDWAFSVDCEVVAVSSVPYVAGQGWVADGGSTWYVVDLRIDPARFRFTGAGKDVDYDVEAADTSVTVDGEVATVLSEDVGEDGGWSATLVAPGTAGAVPPLAVERTYDLSRVGDADTAPTTEQLDVRWDVDLLTRS